MSWFFSNVTDCPTLYLESTNLYMVQKRGSWISTKACVFLSLIFRGAYPTTQGGRFLVRIRTWVTWITGNHQPGAWKNHRQHQQLLPLVSNKGSCFGQGRVFDGMVPPKSPPFSPQFIQGKKFDLTEQQFTTPWVLMLPWGYHKPTDMSAAMDMSHHLYTTISVVWFWASRFCSKRSSTCFVVSQFAERQFSDGPDGEVPWLRTQHGWFFV